MLFCLMTSLDPDYMYSDTLIGFSITDVLPFDDQL